MPPSVLDALATGHEALARGDWSSARDAFQAAVDGGGGADALEGLGWAAWWLSDEQLTFDVRERAYRAHRAAGDPAGAARMAVWLASDWLDFRGDDAVAAGWLERAGRLLEGLAPCAEHGWKALIEADLALRVGAGPDAVERPARAAHALARELRLPDVEAIALGLTGVSLVARGEVVAGMRLLDEGSALAHGETFDTPVAPGWTLCCALSACEGIGDFPRATQWCRALRALVDPWGARSMVGVCRSAYGNVLAANGDWTGAESELLAAIEDLSATRPGMAGSGQVRLGELRARQGRDEEARALFEQAAAHPAAAVGLGRLALRAGDFESAADAAERVLRRAARGSMLERLPALELRVRALSALGRAEEAGPAGAELEQAATALGTPYLCGRCDLAHAELELARGDAGAARRRAEDAIDRLTGCSAPYEAAQAQLALARALAALGREDPAAAAARSARATFERLGAAHDLGEADALLESRGERSAGELTTRELDVLRLVAQGLSDAEIAERLTLSPHTVHRHVANVRVKLRLPSRSAAVAYAARAGLL